MSEPVVQDDGRVACHECNDVFERIGAHWSAGSCDYPSIPAWKESVVTGLMLGDGTLRTHTSSPFVQTYMITRPFLEWLDEELGWLTTGVSLYRTAERGAELSRSNGHPSAHADEYHDVYALQTRTMPQFERYRSWYGPDGKEYPADVGLNPTMLTIWYACDGSLNWDRRYPQSRPYATIGVGSDVRSLFAESSFPYEPVVDETNRFTVDETEALIDWMDDAPPGFEYKWCLSSLNEYESLRQASLGDDPL